MLTKRFCNHITDGFSVPAITAHHIQSPEFATRPLTPSEEIELKKAFSQPYTYFGCGGQAFAFFSEDGQYVIKFFKQRLYHPSPIEYFWKRKREKRLDKLRRDFFSYKVAFEELSDQTGVLYAHLQPTSHLNTQLKITDRLQISHLLDLDRVDFVVQRRATLVYDHIRELMDAHRENEAISACASVFTLIRKRAENGFRDRDPNVRTNCGFINDQAVKIDVGRFVRDPEMPKHAREELIRITGPFREWITHTYPHLLPAFDEELEKT